MNLKVKVAACEQMAGKVMTFGNNPGLIGAGLRVLC